jgi:hypothetical protein
MHLVGLTLGYWNHIGSFIAFLKHEEFLKFTTPYFLLKTCFPAQYNILWGGETSAANNAWPY